MSADKKTISKLRQLNVLDSHYEAVYDSITDLVAKLTLMPVSLISILEEDRMWLKSTSGLKGITRIPRDNRFCDWVVSKKQYLEIEDTTLDDFHSKYLLVTGEETKFRFYAGAPITLPLGEVIGVLCVLDTKPNQLYQIQRSALIGLANLISKALVIKSYSEKTL